MIQPINNTQPSFGKYTVVQVPHKAFKNPKNYLAAEDEFVKICEKAAKMPSAWVARIADFLNIPSCPKLDIYLESPHFSAVMESLQEAGGYSIDWLKMHTGANIKHPKREGFHSFVVLTGKEFDRMSEEFLDSSKEEKRENYLQEKFNESRKNGRSFSQLLVNALVNEVASNELDELFADTKPELVEISELKELPELVKSMLE